jgi:hypothetical protein
VLGGGCWVVGAGWWNVGCWVLGAGCWVLGGGMLGLLSVGSVDGFALASCVAVEEIADLLLYGDPAPFLWVGLLLCTARLATSLTARWL